MKLKSTWVPFILSFISIIGLRIYQFMSVGNASVRIQWDNIELACLIIAIVAVAFIITMSYLSKDVPKIFILNKNICTAIIAIFTSIMIICNAINELMIYMSYDRNLIRLFLGILGLAAGIAFIIISGCYIKGKDLFENYRLLTLLPVGWSLFRLLNVFFMYNSIPTDISSISNLLSEVFILFFLFNQARLFAGLFNSSTFKKIFYFGFASVLFIIICKTNYFINAIDLGKTITFEYKLSIVTSLFIAFYILSFIMMIKGEKNLEGIVETVNNTEKSPEYENKNTHEYVSEDTYIKNDLSEVDALIEDIKNEEEAKIQESEKNIIDQETENLKENISTEQMKDEQE